MDKVKQDIAMIQNEEEAKNHKDFGQEAFKNKSSGTQTPENNDFENNDFENEPLGNVLYGAIATINLDALVHNFNVLSQKAAPAFCAGVIKADAYGLGAKKVGPALYDAGCRLFFVAHLMEALELKKALKKDAKIAILNGIFDNAEDITAQNGFIPVLNSWHAILAWKNYCQKTNQRHPAIIQIDTGMSRLGLDENELQRLILNPEIFDVADIQYIMSHLASGDEENNPSNQAQLMKMQQNLQKLPKCAVTFANSGGIFLGKDFVYDLVRPGIALYGIDPHGKSPTNIQPVLELHAKIIQCRHVDKDVAIGYGGSYITKRPSIIATIALGYADGWQRCLGNKGCAYFKGVKLPIIGRVSMDSITLDVTELGENGIKSGDYVELIGKYQKLEDVAYDANTIPYEILTSLSNRYQRIYKYKNRGQNNK